MLRLGTYSAILSSIFLKERLSFYGKVGCFQCIVGAVVIVLHAPEQSAKDTSIETFKGLVISVGKWDILYIVSMTMAHARSLLGFLVYSCLSALTAILLIIFAVPRWGRSNMLVYISICSLIGAISVIFTQGLGMAIVHSITIENQFSNYFIYIVLLLVLVTLVVEIVYLNKALNIFNTAVVTPTYYVMFTTLTIVSSIVLYRGFGDATSPEDIATCVLGFFSICTGVALLHRDQGHTQQQHSATIRDSDDSLLEQGGGEKIQTSPDDTTAPIVIEGVGPAQLVPFAGITRYASKRVNRVMVDSSSSTAAQQPRQKAVTMKAAILSSSCSSSATSSLSIAANDPAVVVSPSKTIGVGNTKQGEDGYTRELRWKDKWQSYDEGEDEQEQARREEEEEKENWRHQQMEAAAKQVAITIQEPVINRSSMPPCLPPRPPPGRAKRMLRAIPFHLGQQHDSTRNTRAQDQLNRLKAYQIGLYSSSNSGKYSDRTHLVSSSSNNDI